LIENKKTVLPNESNEKSGKKTNSAKLFLIYILFFIWSIILIGIIAFSTIPLSVLHLELMSIFLGLSLFSAIIIYFVYPKYSGNVILRSNPIIDKQGFKLYKEIIYSLIFGAHLFGLFFFLNSILSGLPFSQEYSLIDYHFVSGGKGEKSYIEGKVGDDINSYYFSTMATFNWNFKEILPEFEFKGENRRKYSRDELIRAIESCSNIELTIRYGFFGFDIIDYGECIH
jgi:hypothetical protein